MQQPALTPQQEAIQEVRSRYERGILTFEQFEYALNALLQAETPEQCRAIVQELPATTPTSALAMPAQPQAPAMPRGPRSRMRWMVAFMGGVQRMRRPWRLAEHTQAIAIMGGIELDLNLAALPQQGVIRILAVMGGVKLYVPVSMDVSVRGIALLGGVNALGESSGGIISFTNEESRGQEAAPGTAPRLEIEVFTLMGGVEVIQVDGPVIAGGRPVALPGGDALPLLPYDRHMAHEMRRAARHAAREARRQARYR